MHEMSVAVALVKSLEAWLNEHPESGDIERIHLTVGALCGVDPASLETVWPMALLDAASRLQKSTLCCVIPEFRHRCTACGEVVGSRKWLRECPNCHAESLRRENGQEFAIESIEIAGTR